MGNKTATFHFIVIDPGTVAKTKIAQSPHKENFGTFQAHFA